MWIHSIDGSGITCEYGCVMVSLPVHEYLATYVGKCLSSGRVSSYSTSWGWWRISVTLATGELVLWIVGGRGSLGGAGYVEPASALSLASTWASCGSTW